MTFLNARFLSCSFSIPQSWSEAIESSWEVKYSAWALSARLDIRSESEFMLCCSLFLCSGRMDAQFTPIIFHLLN